MLLNSVDSEAKAQRHVFWAQTFLWWSILMQAFLGAAPFCCGSFRRQILLFDSSVIYSIFCFSLFRQLSNRSLQDSYYYSRDFSKKELFLRHLNDFSHVCAVTFTLIAEILKPFDMIELLGPFSPTL